MNIEIKRCFYSPDIKREAVSLSRELEHGLSVSPRIRWGRPGQMDVLVEGRPIFSKRVAGRLPNPGEVLAFVSALPVAGGGGC